MHPLFQFAVDHPFLAFFLSWPLALTLISLAWTVATLITNSMTQVVAIISSLAALIATLVRGYPVDLENKITDRLMEKRLREGTADPSESKSPPLDP